MQYSHELNSASSGSHPMSFHDHISNELQHVHKTDREIYVDKDYNICHFTIPQMVVI